MNNWPQCTYADHHLKEIIGFCFYPNCKSKQRLLCFYCLKETIHDDHKNEIIDCDKLPQWLAEQQQVSQDFLNTLNTYQENIIQPIQKIQKLLEHQNQSFSEQDLKNQSYSNLNDAIKKQVFFRKSFQFCEKNLKQTFENYGKIFQQFGELMTQQSLTNSTFQKRLNSLNPFVNAQEKNSINQDQLIGNFFQTENNLQRQNSNNQIQQSPEEFLAEFYNQRITTQIDYNIDSSVQDGIEYLIQGEHKKAQCIFETLSQQKTNQETVLWLAYCKYHKKKYQEAIDFLKQFGNIQEYKQNPQFWYIIMISVIALKNFQDALYCIQKYLKLKPLNSKGWIKAGFILLMVGKVELSIKYLDQVIKFEKNSIEAKSYLCLAYYFSNQKELAEKQYLEIFQIDQKSSFLNMIQDYTKKN